MIENDKDYNCKYNIEFNEFIENMNEAYVNNDVKHQSEFLSEI